MGLTFGEVRKIVSSYAGRSGRCASAEEVSLFARQTMQYLLYSGSESAIRKLCIVAHKSCISLPPEVEVPIKVRIDRRLAEVWSKWFTFHHVDEDFNDCECAATMMIEDGAQTPLAHQLPHGGSRIGIVANCEEDCNSHIIVQGLDPTGREIYTTYKGEQVVGVKLSLIKNQIQYSDVIFGEVTAVLKPRTNGYVTLLAVCPKTKKNQYLADYTPSDERPMYRKYKVVSRNCPDIAHVSMLVRVKLKDNYHDNEITLFDNSLAILLAAQRLQAETNNDSQTAAYKKAATEDILEKEASYKKKASGPVDVFFPMSGGAIRGIV